MGEYFYVANLDKKEFLHPHRFGHGMKKWEVAVNAPGCISALAMLISTPAKVEGKRVGSWAGDRIIMCGDYTSQDYGMICEGEETGEWKDISKDIIEELRASDRWCTENFRFEAPVDDQ